METKKILIDSKYYQVSSDDQYLTHVGDEFEPHMTQLFRALLDADDIVADIGANIGLTALLFANLSRLVYAFEPSPSTFAILKQNVDANRIKNIEVFNIGLGEKTDRLNISFANDNRSGGFVNEKAQPSEGHTTEPIFIDTIDNFFSSSKKPPPTFLKIDVEGFAQNVIRGGTQFLSINRPTVVMEMNHFCLNVLQRITLPDFLDFMRSTFPFLYAIDSDNCSIVDMRNADMAYSVMHEHVVKHRFPNLVAGFSDEIGMKLKQLQDHCLIINKVKKAVSDAKQHNGHYPITPLTATNGKITSSSPLSNLSQEEVVKVNVNLINESNYTWYTRGDRPVLLSYHWLKPVGDVYIYDGLRTSLRSSIVSPGAQIEEDMYVIAPQKRGIYQLVLTLVQEGVCWFEDKGFTPLTIEVTVS
ncbi:MAG TPA: hypothetical protein DIS96_09590 [Pusillimonas sp.]|nr:hypothetical protein [Pusillimonas sp.]